MSDVSAEIVGQVLEVVVGPGARVDEGEMVVLLESMKMEIPMLAEHAGVVRSVSVRPGDLVRAGDSVAVVDPLPSAPARAD